MHEDGWPEEEDETAMDGFQEVPTPEQEYSHQPVRPTLRCKRCGCWLSSHNTDGEYCIVCQDSLRRHVRTCAMCGDIFFSESRESVRCPACEKKYQRHKRTCESCGTDFLPYVCVACKPNVSMKHICHACHWRDTHAEEAALRERECRICGCRFLPRRCIVPDCKQKLTDICSVCHEEIYHMSMTATVWTLPDCPLCEKAIWVLEKRHRHVTRLSLEKLSKGEEPNVDAMAHLALTGGAAPLVFIDGRFLEPEEVDALIASGVRA